MNAATETQPLPAIGSTFTRGTRTWIVLEAAYVGSNTAAATKGAAVADITAQCGTSTFALFSLRSNGEVRKVS